MEKIAIFVGLLPIISGLILFIIGSLLADHFESLLHRITHKRMPEELKTNPGIKKVNNLIRTLGILIKLIALSLIIYGVVIIAISISQLFY
ncbi:MAG: hypothetical protein HOK84_13855 [Bacteroidetes bacterium]|jgi:flagellar biosynthesis protein FlhB|nr:hypothetical protein [Bacteroidota bacterium]MBT4398269.1 hypothetical protein [Bacteroidota bacterium]MBT4409054.1 hypothetical protein [Bacteroidota bacterium]MBT5427280.1 hypothetical protein [Bacteroidota bacterium]